MMFECRRGMVGGMAAEPTSRGLAAESSLPQVVEFLLGVLGERMVAVLGGVDDAEVVRRWASGQSPANVDTERRYV